MSQSRFSIVLVGVSALLRRPLVSRLRPADGERSSWVVFTARGCRFDSGFRWASSFFRLPFRSCRSAGWPSGSLLPLFGTHRFGDSAGRVGLRAHRFRFSARTVSEIALGGLAFGLTTSAFRHAPLRSGRWASWFFCLPLRRLPSADWPSGSPLPLFGTHRFGVAAGRVGLRAHRFRFSACADSEWPLGGWPSGLLLRRLPFGGLAFGLTASEIPLGGLAFGFTASAFRHAPIRSGCWASSFFRLPFRRLPLGELAFGLTASAFRHAPLRKLPSAGWPSDSPLPLFGMRRSAPPRRRSEDRRSTPTRHLFHFKTLIPTC